MNAYRLPDDRLLIPRRAEGPDGLIGDGMVEIGPDDPEYEAWLPFAVEPGEDSDAIPSQAGRPLPGE